jgi:hypothetical protein
MLSKALILLLVPFVAAHGKVAQMEGDAPGNPGNTTALAIQGGIVPGPGRNKVVSNKNTLILFRPLPSGSND